MNPVSGPGRAAASPAWPGDSGPTALRIALGGTLRQLREEVGISREVAGSTIRASVAKMSRLELGRVGFKLRDVTDLLTLYRVVDPARREELLELARQANKRGWWHRYSDLLDASFQTYLGLEQAAPVIRTFELQFVPGLLQTPDYARAVTRLAYTSVQEVERRVELRLQRQRLLSTDHKDPPTRLWAVVDESVLRRWVGSDVRVLRAQLDHLLAMSELPNVALQVVPLRHGGHAAAGGSFKVLRFADQALPDVVAIEHLHSAVYLDKPAEVDNYTFVMSELVASVDPPGRTPHIIKQIRDEI
mgnify:CR=1 FL=1